MGVCVGVSVGVCVGVGVGETGMVVIAVGDGVRVVFGFSLPQAINTGTINIRDSIKNVNLCQKQFCRSIEKPPPKKYLLIEPLISSYFTRSIETYHLSILNNYCITLSI